MAHAHGDALARIPGAEVVAVAGRGQQRAEAAAAALGADRAYGDWRALISDPAIDVVHNCTPTALHAEISLAALRAGKHVMSEKPLAATLDEGRALVRAAAEAKTRTATAFNYRFYSAVGRLRQELASGEHEAVHLVHGGYLQDWLLPPTVASWRLDPAANGPSLAVADIGSHWFDLVQYLLGERVTSVLADLGTLRPAGSLEDHGMLLARTERGTRLQATVSQVSAGHKNRLFVEVDAGDASFCWEQEHPNQLVIGRRGRSRELWERDSGDAPEADSPSGRLPAGHPEGWRDALASLCARFYRAVRAGTREPASSPYPTFADGHRAIAITAAALASNQSGTWEAVELEPYTASTVSTAALPKTSQEVP
jgi:predicted dehydrogenase